MALFRPILSILSRFPTTNNSYLPSFSSADLDLVLLLSVQFSRELLTTIHVNQRWERVVNQKMATKQTEPGNIMVTRKTKFSISIEKVKIEFEGSQELGQQIHQGVQHAIGGLLNAQNRLLSLREQPGQIIDGEDVESAASPGSTATDGNGEKQKQHRQRRSKGGTSPMNLLRALKQEGFFSQPRPVSEIMIRLRDKGHNCRQEIVSTRLLELTQKEELHRASNGEEGVYVYKDTPFHESTRSPSPADYPAE